MLNLNEFSNKHQPFGEFLMAKNHHTWNFVNTSFDTRE